MLPKISIIVPVFNVNEFLSRCVSSILDQTLKNIEVILVDDGSTDGSAELCDRLALGDNRIKVVHRSNGGLGEARNSGLEIAKGDFVGFVDGDDYIKREMYQSLLKVVEDNDLSACFSGFIRVSNDKPEVRNEVEKLTIWRGFQQLQSFVFNMIGSKPSANNDFNYSMSVCTAIFNRSIIQKQNLKFQSERKIVSEDLFFNLAFIEKCNAVGMSEKCYYNYVENKSSLTHQYDTHKFDRNIIMIHQVRKKLLASSFDEKQAERYVERLLLARARGGVRGITLNSVFGFEEKRKFVKHILNNHELRSTLVHYPIHQLPKKQRLFVYSMKFRWVTICQFMIYVRNLSKKW